MQTVTLSYKKLFFTKNIKYLTFYKYNWYHFRYWTIDLENLGYKTNPKKLPTAKASEHVAIFYAISAMGAFDKKR